MYELLCTPRTKAQANLEIEESTGPHENWVVDAFLHARQGMAIFLHLPTQYCLVAGPFPSPDLPELRPALLTALRGAMQAEQFDTTTIDRLIDEFSHLRLAVGEPEPHYLQVLADAQAAYTRARKADGDAFDLTAFNTGLHAAKTAHGISPRETLALWLTTLPFES
jgi:hypothetical protein